MASTAAPPVGHFFASELSWAFECTTRAVTGGPEVEVAAPRVDAAAELVPALRGRAPARMPIARIVQAVGAASAAWLEGDGRWRRWALDALPATTGFSAEMIGALLDGLFPELAEPALWTLLEAELGDPLVLDGFRPKKVAPGLTHAYGAGVVGAVFAGGNPFLPAIEIAKALLTKSPILARPPSSEPLFAAAFCRSLEEVDEELAGAVVVCSWPRTDDALGFSLLSRLDRVVVSGDDETIDVALRLAGDPRRVVVHGARMGVALVAEDTLADGAADLARRLALSVALADQLTCLSPQVVYVERGGDVSAESFAHLVADGLRALERTLPRGRPDRDALVELERTRARYRFRGFAGGEDALLCDGGSWLVAVDRDVEARPGPGYRTLRVCPVDDLALAIAAVGRIRPLVSTAGLAASPARAAALAPALAAAGVRRICAPERMLMPPLSWHDDGIAQLAPLLLWTDVELPGCDA